jgi:hypothetical protein
MPEVATQLRAFALLKRARGCHNARPGAACGVAGIVVDRPFCFFCGYDKRNSLRGNERYRSDKLIRMLEIATLSLNNDVVFIYLNKISLPPQADRNDNFNK